MSFSNRQAVEVVLRVHDSHTLMGVGCVRLHAVHPNRNVCAASLNGPRTIRHAASAPEASVVAWMLMLPAW